MWFETSHHLWRVVILQYSIVYCLSVCRILLKNLTIGTTSHILEEPCLELIQGLGDDASVSSRYLSQISLQIQLPSM